MLQLKTLLENTTELPSLPELYAQVAALIEDENSTAYDIGKAVQADPYLTTRVLKMINSAYYGIPTEVTSVAQAVNLLGRYLLKDILVGSMLSGMFDDVNSEHFSLNEFWQHSLKTAIIARHLAMQSIHIIDHEAFFTAGLLHDIGRLVMARIVPEQLAKIKQRTIELEGNEIQAEMEYLGLSHIDIGAALIKKWKLPSMISQCLVKHHDTEHIGPHAVDTCIVYLANQLSKHELATDEQAMQDILTGIPNWEQSNCPPDQILIACQLADEQWYELMESFGMIDQDTKDDLYWVSN